MLQNKLKIEKFDVTTLFLLALVVARDHPTTAGRHDDGSRIIRIHGDIIVR